MFTHWTRAAALAILSVWPTASGSAQTAAPEPVRLEKVDPPSWFAGLPRPMLLVRGEGLSGATFQLSDAALRIERTVTSDNGHWTQLWLAASPQQAESIEITASHGTENAAIAYQFAAPRSPGEGMAGFSSADVMYLIMTDRFARGSADTDSAELRAEKAKPRGWHGGDFRGITEHLDYLQQLGITTVWLTPIQQNSGEQSYHGYGATDLYAVDPHFGSLVDLQQLVAALHARHMKFVLDTVPNHVGPQHPWVTDSPDPTWFHGTLAHHSIAQGEFGPLTDPHAPWRDQRDVTLGWFANVLPDLNQEDPAVAQYLIQNTIWWIEEIGVDGLRIDTFPYVGREFWRSFHAQLHALFPHLTSVGEIFNGDPTITSTFAGGVTRTGIDTGLDTPFDFPSYFALRNVFLKDHPMTELRTILRQDNLYPHPERLVPFLGNHDTTRFMNEPGATPVRFALAFTVLATMRGMPQIYSGDEIAMRGGEDPDNRQDFPASAFFESGRTAEQQQAFATVARLLTLRREHPALQSGEEQVLAAASETFVYVRAKSSERIVVAINKSRQEQTLAIDTTDTAIAGYNHADMLSGSAARVSFNGATLTLRLAPESTIILKLT